MQHLKNWYMQLGKGGKLLVLYSIQWLYWFLAWGAYRMWIAERPGSVPRFLLEVTLMSLILTLSFHYQRVKDLFKKKKHEQ